MQKVNEYSRFGIRKLAITSYELKTLLTTIFLIRKC